MGDEAAFHDLLRRVRHGDQAAATDLVRRYEPVVRRVARFRMRDPRLAAQIDSMDVCQSVLMSFFVRVAAGEYDLERPEELVNLLATMARNKLATKVRREQARRRDRRRQVAVSDCGQIAGTGPTPSREIAGQEILREVLRRLSREERQLVELRSAGREWASIAAELGSDAVVLRKRLSRALSRITAEMGFDEGHDD